MNKNNTIWVILIVIIILVLAYLGYKYYVINFEQKNVTENLPQKIITVVDPLNASYAIENYTYKLINGKAEKEIAPGSIEKIKVSIFGALNFGDLNNDKVTDAVAILVYTPILERSLLRLALMRKTLRALRR